MSKSTAIYCRVSSEKQAQDGTIESQISSLREFCVTQGFQIDDDLIFIDNGVSGTTLVRPSLDALRDKAVAGEINQILILCPDRLARKYAHQLILVEEFKKLGVEIIFANRAISNSPEDQLLFQIQGVIAEFEREKIVERSRRGKLHKAKTGKISVLAGAPYGFVYISATDKEDARYEIHPEEAKVVKNVFHYYSYDRQSIGAIAKKLTSEGIPTRHNIGHWDRSVIWLMLKNPAYIGKAAYRKTQVAERLKPTKLARDNGLYPKRPKSSIRDRDQKDWITIPVPQIVSEDIFEKAHVQLQENKKLSPRNNKKYEYLLSGLLHCKECGYSIYGKPASNSKYKRLYYRCMGQDYRWPTGRVCSAHPVRVEVLDELVWEQVKSLIEEPEVVINEYARRIDSKKKETFNHETLINKKKKEIRMQEQQKERILDLYQSGTISLLEVEERLKNIRLRITKFHNECALLNQEEKQKQQCLQLVEKLDDFKKKMNLNLPDLKFEEKKQLVRLLVSEVVVDIKNEDIKVTHIIPVQKNVPLCLGSNNSPLGSSHTSQYSFSILSYHRCL